MIGVRPSLLGALAAVAILASACGSDDKSSGTTASSSSADGGAAKTCIPTSPEKLAQWCSKGGKPKVVVIVGTTDHSFYTTLGAGATEEAKRLGIDVEVQGAKEFSPAAQAPVLNAVIQGKPDAIIIALTSPTALNPQLKRAAQAGIVVFTADNDTSDEKLRWTNVGTDHVASGKAAAATMAAAIKSAGKIAMLASTPGPLVERLRIQGFTDGLKSDTQLEPLPTEYCAGDPARCASSTSGLISANADLKGVFGVGEPMGVGAGNGVRSSHKQGKVIVGAFDASPAQQRDLRQGIVDALVVQRPKEIGGQAVNIAAQVLQGKKTISSTLLTSSVGLDALPPKVFSGFSMAVKNTSMCPAERSIDCGTADDPKISKWFYVG